MVRVKTWFDEKDQQFGVSRKWPAPRDYEQRAAQIVALRWEGKTFDDIGRIFGICRERVRKVLVKQKTLGLAIPTYQEIREIRARIGKI